eukprot:CAMPEP_0177642928 /NCGR_PEP_ID=MMETSP0447-20121125/7879_1 /TAXON_ID=0 /ORGANISM="Stygamoeba regulata, Strain BSH-02190019" /LENGTH=87 /DNA_ID=CAMNT_0019145181 /DNA_START=184 /DNA_END=447 /DNA_ORIENTATION=+
MDEAGSRDIEIRMAVHSEGLYRRIVALVRVDKNVFDDLAENGDNLLVGECCGAFPEGDAELDAATLEGHIGDIEGNLVVAKHAKMDL